MTISILGIVMILVTLVVVGYLGFQAVSSTISTNVGSGTSYDKIADLNSDFDSLQTQYNSTKETVDSRNNQNLTQEYDNAEIQLIQAQSDISAAQSAIESHQSPEEIQNRINVAQTQLDTASNSLNNLNSQLG
jgi:chromosome segregation ATPase